MIDKLIKDHVYWNNHSEVSFEDWQYEIANGDTRVSYWEYVVKILEQPYMGTQKGTHELKTSFWNGIRTG